MDWTKRFIFQRLCESRYSRQLSADLWTYIPIAAEVPSTGELLHAGNTLAGRIEFAWLRSCFFLVIGNHRRFRSEVNATSFVTHDFRIEPTASKIIVRRPSAFWVRRVKSADLGTLGKMARHIVEAYLDEGGAICGAVHRQRSSLAEKIVKRRTGRFENNSKARLALDVFLPGNW